MFDWRFFCTFAFVCGLFVIPSYGQTAHAVGSVVRGTATPLVAQSSAGGYGQQTSQPRFRARTWIKGGMALAALIAGMIGFFVKWIIRRGSESSPLATTHFVDEQTTQSQANAPFSPLPNASPVDQKDPSHPPADAKASPYAKPSSSGAGVSGVTIVMLAALVVLPVAICCLGVALFAIFWFSQVKQVQDHVGSLDELEQSVVELQQAQAEQAARNDWQATFDQGRASEFSLPETTFSDPATESATQPPAPQVVAFPELPATVTKLPPDKWSIQDLSTSGVMLSRDGNAFEDMAPEQGVLVGLRVTKDRRQLKSIQAIYQVGDRYELGKVLGREAKEERTQLLAEPGQVVAAVRVDYGFQIVGIQVAFAEMKDGAVAWEEVTTSPFVGLEVKQNSVVIEGEGDAFAGVTGYTRSGIDGLALRRISRLNQCAVAIDPVIGEPRKQLAHAGGKAGTEFSQFAPEGGVLVGMRFFLGRNWGGAIQGVQPIFQVGDQYHVGQRAGKDGGLMREVVARPGYAIEKIDVNAGLVLNSARLTFSRVTPTGLDGEDTYTSQRFGSRGGGAFVIDADGRYLIGIGGTFREDLISLTAYVNE